MNIDLAKNCIKEWFSNIASVFILWIIIHYIAANMYAYFCAELSLFGVIKSVFVTMTPHCVAMRWVIYNGGNAINTMWISAGLWISGKIFKTVFTK